MSKTKYTRELLEPLVKESTSIAQVLRKLKLKPAGGSHTHISRKIKKYGLDDSHFLGQGANCGPNKKGGPRKKNWDEYLVKRTEGQRQKAYVLRRALIESGREYVCEECDQIPEWRDQELRLQVDHKNSNWLDDRLENLRFLCPNCHTQTDGYNNSKGKSDVTSVDYVYFATHCEVCGKGLKKKRKTGLCINCYRQKHAAVMK